MFKHSTQMMSIEETDYISNAKKTLPKKPTKQPTPPPPHPQKTNKQKHTNNKTGYIKEVIQFSATCLVGSSTSMSEKLIPLTINKLSPLT